MIGWTKEYMLEEIARLLADLRRKELLAQFATNALESTRRLERLMQQTRGRPSLGRSGMEAPTPTLELARQNTRIAWAAVLSTEDAADAARAAWIAARDALDAEETGSLHSEWHVVGLTPQQLARAVPRLGKMESATVRRIQPTPDTELT